MSPNVRLFAFSALVIIVTWSFSNTETQAQVTFSRDWNPGKRMAENSEFHGAMKTASAICHLLLNQIRQIATCENSKGDDLDPGASTIFNGGR